VRRRQASPPELRQGIALRSSLLPRPSDGVTNSTETVITKPRPSATHPRVGWINPAGARSSVVFPQPLGPTTDRNSPARVAILTDSRRRRDGFEAQLLGFERAVTVWKIEALEQAQRKYG
jgi:hypothetical protein